MGQIQNTPWILVLEQRSTGENRLWTTFRTQLLTVSVVTAIVAGLVIFTVARSLPTRIRHAEEARESFIKESEHTSKLASVGRLAAGVAHEINNPLGVILGYAGYLEGKMDPADPNLRYIQEIRRESKRCKGIVQDLLSYARTPQPALEESDINALLEQIADFAANHLDLTRVTVARRFASDVPRVLVDPRSGKR